MFKNICKIFCFLFITITFLVLPTSKSIATDEYQVIFFTSYDSDNTIFNKQLRGIQKSLSSDPKNSYKLYVEHMDFSSENIDTTYSNIKDYLKSKSYLYKNIDAIIVGDNLTLEFLLSLDDTKNISKFFLGIDNQELIDLAIESGFDGGVEEITSIESTVDAINEVTKENNKNLIFLLPNSNLYTNELDTFYSIEKKYPKFNFSHMYIPTSLDEKFSGAINRLNNKDNVILFLDSYKESKNNLDYTNDVCNTIFNLINVPIFNLVGYSELDYCVGGKVLDAYNQGFELANLILNKFNYNLTPTFISYDKVNKWIFNYNYLNKFYSLHYKYEDNVEVIGAPLPLRKQALEDSLPFVIIIISLIIIIWALCLHLIKKHKYEKELHHAKQHAEDMNLAKNNFISNISHELRTPVTVIMSSTQLLKLLINKNSDLNIESINHNFDIIEQNSNRLLRLVNNIIDIAKTDSNAIDLNLQNINIVELFENTVLSIVPYAQIKNIDVVFDTDVEEIITAVDIEKIERVLLNLLSNAIKFSNYNGSIYTSISLEDNNIILKVKDNGIGIEKKHFKNIFKKFNQVDNGFTRHNEGSGIGLSIVGSFIELHGGNVSVSSLKGLGTTFTVSLPINTTCQDVNNNFLSSDKNVDIELSDIYFDRYANN